MLFEELVRGDDLKTLSSPDAARDWRMLNGKSSADQDQTLLGVAYQLVSGLEHVHGSGLAHFDFKPGNVMVALPHLDAKLTDFGVSSVRPARAFHNRAAHSTQHGCAPSLPDDARPPGLMHTVYASSARTVGPCAALARKSKSFRSYVL